MGIGDGLRGGGGGPLRCSLLPAVTAVAIDTGGEAFAIKLKTARVLTITVPTHKSAESILWEEDVCLTSKYRLREGVRGLEGTSRSRSVPPARPVPGHIANTCITVLNALRGRPL